MSTLVLLVTIPNVESNNSFGYITGVIIALLILGYLFYTLVKPEKF